MPDDEPKEPSLVITIEVFKGNPVAVVRDNCGNVKHLQGVSIFGATRERDELYGFAWGDPTHVAYGIAETFAQGDDYYDVVYRALLMTLMKRTGARQNVTAQELLDRWEAEDAEKAVTQAPAKKEGWN